MPHWLLAVLLAVHLLLALLLAVVLWQLPTLLLQPMHLAGAQLQRV